jgi:hypothetical protein
MECLVTNVVFYRFYSSASIIFVALIHSLMVSKYNIIFFFLLFSMLSAFSQLQPPPVKPKLIIGIVIDQVHPDYLSRYYNNFSEKGFRLFIDNGYTFSNASYNYAFSQKATDHATITTGTTPRFHGVTGYYNYNRKTDEKVLSVYDESTLLIGITPLQKGFSANALKASTIGDELKISTYGNSKVFSIAIEPPQAVLLGGHAADGAYWFDDKNGKWITSNAYASWLPEWVENFNKKNFASFYLNAKWDLLLPETAYLYDAKRRIYKDYSLPQTFESNKNKARQFAFLNQTPFGNMLIKDFAIDCIKNEQLGSDEFTDLIFVNFSSLASKADEYGPYSIEMEDHYIRLDREIEALMRYVEQEVGRQNVLVFLTGTQRAHIKPDYLKQYNVPSGYFMPDRAMALLNSYLMAFYGQGKWVQKYMGQQIYLNRDLIESSKIDMQEVQERTAEFMKEFTGVAFAVPSYLFAHSEYYGGFMFKFQQSYNYKNGGDVLLSFEPGWIEAAGSDGGEGAYGLANTGVPLSFYGWKIGRGKSASPVAISDITPTICTLTGIPLPNAATGKPIEELLK